MCPRSCQGRLRVNGWNLGEEICLSLGDLPSCNCPGMGLAASRSEFQQGRCLHIFTGE